ncbi:MAG TPA: ATP-binding protein [Polyangia bacterium]
MSDRDRNVSSRRRYELAAAAVVAVLVAKLVLAKALGREAPAAFFGLGVLSAGWFAGARAALAATFLLVASEAALFGAAGEQVALLLTEGLVMSALVRAMTRARFARALPEAAARRHLEILADLGAALSGALTREEVAAVVVGRGAKAMVADICTLYVMDDWDGSLELIGDAGVAPEVLARIRRISESDNSPSFDTLKSERPLWVETEEQYKDLFPALFTIAAEAPRARAFWSVPLIVEGRPFGLLGMGFYEPRRFSPDERTFVETFTGYCAQAVRRAQRLEAEQRSRRAAEHAEASLSTTLRSIGDAVITTDNVGRITFMNPVAEQLTGWGEAEARGRPLRAVFRIVNEHTRREVESPVDKVLKEGAVVGLANHTVLLGLRPGQETPIDDSGAPIRDESGVHGVVLVFRDVSHKKDEEARRTFLADATSTLASSLDHHATLTRLAELLVPRFGDWCAIDVVDAESQHPRRLVVTHTDPAKVRLARELAERYPDAPDAATGVPNVLRTGQSELHANITEEMVMAAARDDDHRRILAGLMLRSAMIVPLRTRGHTLGAISLVYAESGKSYTADDLAFLQDVARRASISIDNARLFESERRARTAADVANRTKDEFLATISHELRTPLNAILGWARLMTKTPNDEARRVRAVEIIDRNAVAMAQLIEDLLDVSRIISGKVRLEVGPVDIDRVLQAAVDSVRLGIEAKDLRLRVSMGGELDLLRGDVNRLQQVMWNLLSNAVKFTGKGGRIDVTVERRATAVEIKVADSGKGIGADFLPYVFDPFRQADGSITRAQGGLGLGLAISRHLVELHGGSIRVESAGDEQGATFTVSLPTAPDALPRSHHGQPPRTALAEERPPQLLGLKVLAVDDDSDARHLVQTVLEECGSAVRLASTVAEAIEAFEEQIPDVLLSDIGMPGEDGYALIRRVRALSTRAGGGVPAAALTAYTRAEDRLKVLDAGYTVHVPKPVAPDELIAVVANLAQLARRSSDVVG